MELRKNVILRRPQSGRLEGRERIIQIEIAAFSSGIAIAGWARGELMRRGNFLTCEATESLNR